MRYSNWHEDTEWCVVGPVSILYHTTISMNVAVQYDQRTVFGSHGAYAVWTGTDPRSFSVSASMVAANSDEVKFNVKQVVAAYDWTQESPPSCQKLTAPTGTNSIFGANVRPESVDSSIQEAVHFDKYNNGPIQIELSLSVKECKEI